MRLQGKGELWSVCVCLHAYAGPACGDRQALCTAVKRREGVVTSNVAWSKAILQETQCTAMTQREIKFKIKKGWKCIIDSMCQLQNAIVIGIYSHTSQMITGAVQVIYCLREGLTQWKSRGQGCKNPEVGILGNMQRNIGARQHICSWKKMFFFS